MLKSNCRWWKVWKVTCKFDFLYWKKVEKSSSQKIKDIFEMRWLDDRVDNSL